MENKGKWIFIIKMIPTKEQVHMLSLYFAKPSGKIIDGEPQMEVTTESGKVCIHPWEYNECTPPKMAEYLNAVEDEDADIIHIKGIAPFDTEGEEENSYLRMHPGYVDYFTRNQELTKAYYLKHFASLMEIEFENEATAFMEKVSSVEGYEETVAKMQNILTKQDKKQIEIALLELKDLYTGILGEDRDF